MCVAVPGRVEEIDDVTAVVDVGGATVRARIDLVPEVRVGEYVLIHAGFALERMDEEEALETLRLLAEADRLYQAGLSEEDA
jgi:hydrogenase expression/formation protein HypC